jgi:hypothetical protein
MDIASDTCTTPPSWTPPRTRARHLRHGHRLDGELRPRRNSGYAQLVKGESSHDLRMEASLKVLT